MALLSSSSSTGGSTGRPSPRSQSVRESPQGRFTTISRAKRHWSTRSTPGGRGSWGPTSSRPFRPPPRCESNSGLCGCAWQSSPSPTRRSWHSSGVSQPWLVPRRRERRDRAAGSSTFGGPGRRDGRSGGTQGPEGHPGTRCWLELVQRRVPGGVPRGGSRPGPSHEGHLHARRALQPGEAVLR